MSGAFSKLTAGFGHQQSKDEGHNHKPEEHSLASILPTREHRAAFLVLISECIESMRKRVVDTFDPKSMNLISDKILHSLDQSTKNGLPATQNEPENVHTQILSSNKTETSTNSSVEASESIEDRESRLRAEYLRREKELATESMQTLKSKSLEHFDSWSEKVIQRVGEIINRVDVPTAAAGVHSDVQQQSHPLNSTVQVNKGAPAERYYTPQETALLNLEEPKRVLVLHSLLLLLLSLESYTSESRVLMLRVSSSLRLPPGILAENETALAKGLLQAAKQQMNADEETKKQAHDHSSSRKWKVGLGAAAGAVLIGVTGGLAAPLIAAGVGTVMGGIGLGATATAGYLGALAGSAPLVGVLFGAYGGRMTGKMVDAYAKEVEDFAFIPVRKQSKFHLSNTTDEKRLRVAIGVSGWLTEEAEVVKPWQVLESSIEVFALRWELKALLALGNSLTIYIKSAAWGWAKKEIISRTIFATLSSALTLPYGMAKAARVIDNPFSVARSRSDKAGKVLADALINKVQGERPVTLIGYSMGARLIYACLIELADRGGFGIVESVVLAGAPVPSNSLEWRKIRSVVAGRVVNVYSDNDYLLGFLYRASSLQYGVAGLQKIEDVSGIENVDASELVDGHLQYRYLTGRILQSIGLEDVNATEVEQQVARLKQEEQAVAAERRQQIESGQSAEEESKDMEKKIEERNKASQALDWVNDRISSLGLTGSKESPSKEPASETPKAPKTTM